MYAAVEICRYLNHFKRDGEEEEEGSAALLKHR